VILSTPHSIPRRVRDQDQISSLSVSVLVTEITNKKGQIIKTFQNRFSLIILKKSMVYCTNISSQCFFVDA